MSGCGSCFAYEDRGKVAYVLREYDPQKDFCQYKVPTMWINKLTKTGWYLVSKENGVCEWIQLPKDMGPFIKQIITQCGTIDPDENGVIEFCAKDGLYVGADDCEPRWLDLFTKNGLSGGGRVNLGESLTFSLDLATNEETIIGELETKPVSPASLSAKLGEQTLGRFAMGNGKANVLDWGNIVSPKGTISTFYNSATKDFDIDVKTPAPTDWKEEELAEAATMEDAKDHTIYLGNAVSRITITLTSKNDYVEHAQFYMVSLSRGWVIQFLYPNENGQIYADGKVGTKVESSTSDPTNKDFIKLTFIKHSNIWLAESYSPGIKVS